LTFPKEYEIFKVQETGGQYMDRDELELIDVLLMIDFDTDTFYGAWNVGYVKVRGLSLDIEEVSKDEVINFYKQKERSNELTPWEKQSCLLWDLVEE